MAGHIVGRTYLAGLFELIHICEIHRRDIALTITQKGRFGKILIQDGNLADAVCGDLRGDDAVIELFRWLESEFHLVALNEKVEHTIRRSNFDILLTALQATEGLQFPRFSVEHTMEGPLELMSPIELLQLFEMNHRDVRIKLSKNGEIGAVHLRDGGVVHATLGQAQGDEAVYDLLTWLHGSFQAQFARGKVPETVVNPVSTLVLEGTRRIDELKLQEEEERKKREELSARTLKELEEGKLSTPMRIALAKRYLPRGGAMPVEKLIELVKDPDMEVRQQALESVADLPLVVLRAIIEDTDTPDAVFYHVGPKFADDVDVVNAALANPVSPDATIARIAARATPAVLALIKEHKERVERSKEIQEAITRNEQRGAIKPVDRHEEEKKEKKRGTLSSQLAQMRFPEKLFLAVKGSYTERMVLVRNPDKRIGLAVVGSPKTTAKQVESIACMKAVNAEVLEEIASRNEWTNQYPIAKALVMNPKTPPHAAAQLVRKLRDMDLKKIFRDRNLHESVRNQAMRRIAALDQKRKK